MSRDREREGETPLEVEVERLPAGYDPAADPGPGGAGRRARPRLEGLGETLGLLIAGLLVDLLDAATPTPVLGLALGWPLGAYIVRQAGGSLGLAWKLGLLIGLYCATPGTLLIPMATIVVVGLRLREALRRS